MSDYKPKVVPPKVIFQDNRNSSGKISKDILIFEILNVFNPALIFPQIYGLKKRSAAKPEKFPFCC